MRRAVQTAMATAGSASTSAGEPTTPAVAPVSSSGSGRTAHQPTTEIRASAVSSPRHVQATSKLALRQLDAGSRVLKTTCFWVPFARKVHPAVLFSEARYHCVHKICQFFLVPQDMTESCHGNGRQQGVGATNPGIRKL